MVNWKLWNCFSTNVFFRPAKQQITFKYKRKEFLRAGRINPERFVIGLRTTFQLLEKSVFIVISQFCRCQIHATFISSRYLPSSCYSMSFGICFSWKQNHIYSILYFVSKHLLNKNEPSIQTFIASGIIKNVADFESIFQNLKRILFLQKEPIW